MLYEVSKIYCMLSLVVMAIFHSSNPGLLARRPVAFRMGHTLSFLNVIFALFFLVIVGTACK